ncbi:MAG: FAD-dependent oxidoreductase [Pseudanabaenaceae cyanobacterium bins.68]|nr:FAD-dependent oxidoreductase [Pseudanabaenaceae cyanobacterium bins.68]
MAQIKFIKVPVIAWAALAHPLVATGQNLPLNPTKVECDVLVVGGGLAGTAAAHSALLAGKNVCITEITDWLGGQLTAQGTSALDEAGKQRRLNFFAQGYRQFRQQISAKYGKANPGDCWVSAICFLPKDAKQILSEMLRNAETAGRGKLQFFPRTVVKDLKINQGLLTKAIAIQHQPNDLPLSQLLAAAYDYQNPLTQQVLEFIPQQNWIVIDATETGELLAIADLPYQLGLDPRTYLNPSSPVTRPDPYCTQGFTYTFALEQTATPQPQVMPPFYSTYQPYYGYDPNPRLNNFDVVFSYRRIWSSQPRATATVPVFGVSAPKPGDISMQNWVWGNDYRPGTSQDNLIYTRSQLEQSGQLQPGGWQGGLRLDTLRKGEEIALGFYYWLVAGTTDSQTQPSLKQVAPNHSLLTGLDSPMGTRHGLSKYPYIRESRRLVGRPGIGYAQGFVINEVDLSQVDFQADYYRQLPESVYRQLWKSLAGLETARVVQTNTPPDQIKRRSRARIYPDSVGIAQYHIDFHPCMRDYPAEKPGNIERPGVRQAQAASFPAQIPLRAMIPQKVDNLLVAGKAIATSNIAAAAYRVHSFEWSVGAAAGTTAAFALDQKILPFQLTESLPKPSIQLLQLRRILEQDGNPTAFPGTSIFNLDWQDWKIWGS